ncbi:Alpha/Beta hydrolase protein [Xylariaceae sp. FL1019]|nr:Alpha/Beta hydrolase protein [Xylariaceae sp. FL1019]
MIRTKLAACLAAWSFGASAFPSRSSRAVEKADDLLSFTIPESLTSDASFGAPPNDFSCKSSHNPVVIIHGLGSSADTDLNTFQEALNDRGYCTFAITYGAYPILDWVGGLRDMTETAQDLAAFILEVQSKTSASKIDLVGHSEGGVQSLYVPLTQDGVSEIVEHIVALGPSIHGAPYYGLTDLTYIGGNATRELIGELIDAVGCPACEQLATGGEIINQLEAAPSISQPGNKITIITSSSDTLVPPDVTRVDEPGVNNVLVQTSCPDDTVGHGNLATDKSVWNLIVQALEETTEQIYECEIALPI